MDKEEWNERFYGTIFKGAVIILFVTLVALFILAGLMLFDNLAIDVGALSIDALTIPTL